MHLPFSPELLAAPLALALCWAAARRRSALLALGCALHPLLEPAWQVGIGIAAAAELARVASGQPPRWRTPLAAGAGLAAGLWLRGRLGAPPDAEVALAPAGWFALAAAAALALAAAALAWRRRALGPLPLAFAWSAVGLAPLTLRRPALLPHLALFALAALPVAARAGRARSLAPRRGP